MDLVDIPDWLGVLIAAGVGLATLRLTRRSIDLSRRSISLMRRSTKAAEAQAVSTRIQADATTATLEQERRRRRLEQLDIEIMVLAEHERCLTVLLRYGNGPIVHVGAEIATELDHLSGGRRRRRVTRDRYLGPNGSPPSCYLMRPDVCLPLSVRVPPTTIGANVFVSLTLRTADGERSSHPILTTSWGNTIEPAPRTLGCS